MAVLFQMTVPMSTDQYDTLNAALQKHAPGIFAGCLAHVAVPVDGGMQISDLWESTDALEAFQARMMPIAAEVGVAPPPGGQAPEPVVSQVHAYWLPGA
ncbi:hypothetical protein [Yinghuangia seranimata]|uniref:hypothetical protein n=1 Tax=Yinghuangia seranimata TaxID=408067 RepID=UPI00248BB147|nr:hypothetical protein [Yinghuangia seranimata]MDI2129185.1 hypothetical protein [Yinghuangia seranimata]